MSSLRAEVRVWCCVTVPGCMMVHPHIPWHPLLVYQSTWHIWLQLLYCCCQAFSFMRTKMVYCCIPCLAHCGHIVGAQLMYVEWVTPVQFGIYLLVSIDVQCTILCDIKMAKTHSALHVAFRSVQTGIWGWVMTQILLMQHYSGQRESVMSKCYGDQPLRSETM